MKGLSIKIPRGLTIGSTLVCADNTGAKELQIIGVKTIKSVRKRRSGASIGDLVAVRVSKGKFELKKQVLYSVIVRQRKEFQRNNGLRIKFEDNAGILVNDDGTPKGSKIKGPVAKESIERFSGIGKISTMVV